MKETSVLNEYRPRARIQTTSPLMFETDDEDALDDDDSTGSSNKENCNESAENSAEPTKEEIILKGLQTVLMGIPPPPAFTVPQYDSREMLKLWRENQSYRVVLSPGKGKADVCTKLEEEAKTTKWPDIMKIDHWDVYYNKSTISEEVEQLCVRYKERYVGVETSSCINALYVKSPHRTASARKRARNRAWGHSPGRRLSHLARRRKAFSSANLCSVAGNNNPDKKMIMVEIKKMGNRQKRKSSVKKKTNPTPRKKNQAQASTFKRALFQSPDQLPKDKASKTPSSQCIQRSKRNLFADCGEKFNENGKRERPGVRRISPRKRVNRSLSFHENGQTASPQISQGPLPHTAAKRPLQNMLTGAHKQKMLWAVTNALREEGMGMNHELFRSCMSVLFKTCQKLWLMKAAKQGGQEGSTSENMLALAKQFTTYTIKEIGADPTSEHMTLVCTNIIRMAEKTIQSTVTGQVGDNQSSSNSFRENESKVVCKERKTSSAEKTDKSSDKTEIFLGKPLLLGSDVVEAVCPGINKLHNQNAAEIMPNFKKTPKKLCHITRRTSYDLRATSPRIDRLVLTESCNKSSEKKNSPTQTKPLLTDATILTSPVTRSRKAAMNLINTSNSVDPILKSLAKEDSSDKTDEALKSPICKSSCLTPLKSGSRSTANFVPLNESDSSVISKLEINLPSTSSICSTVSPVTEHPSNNIVSDKIDQTLKQTISKSSPKTILKSATKESTPAKSVTFKDSDNTIKIGSDIDCVSPDVKQYETENSLSQRSVSSEAKGQSEVDLETNKENMQNQRLVNGYSENSLENGRDYSSHKYFVENTPSSQLVPTETISRTLQLYHLSNSGKEHVHISTNNLVPVVVYKEPPKLFPHWEQEEESESEGTSVLSDSPPSLVPHWEQTNSSDTSKSLPEYIMPHWQQLTNNINPSDEINTSDKIMFDFEDTSFEITFPSTNEESRTSSTCAQFDYPPLIDDSKSGFNTEFRRVSTESYVSNE